MGMAILHQGGQDAPGGVRSVLSVLLLPHAGGDEVEDHIGQGQDGAHRDAGNGPRRRHMAGLACRTSQ